MKRKLFLIASIFALAFAASPKASAQWEQINGKGGCVATSFASSGSNIFAGTNNGVLLSTDSGLTWNVVDAGLEDSNVTALFAFDTTVLAGTERDDEEATSIYRWNASSQSWELTGSPPTFYAPLYGFTIVGPLLYAITDRSVAISVDGGNTWTYNDTSFSSVGLLSIVSKSTLLFAGTNSGIYSSLDFGTSWQRTSSDSLGGISISALAVLGNNLFAGSQSNGTPYANDNGIFRSTDYGVTWSQVYNYPPISVSAFFEVDSDIYAGTNQGVLLSTDRGNTWTTLNTGLTNWNVQAIGLTNGTFFAGTKGDGIFRSVDSGLNWSANNTGVTGTTIRTLFHSNTALFVGDDAGGNSYDGGVMRSTNEGMSWKSVSPDSATQDVTSFAFIDNILFMGTGDQLGYDDDLGLFTSTNDGSSWELRNTGLSSGSAIFADASIGNHLLAGSFETGLFLSTDTGNIWLPVSLDNKITCLDVKGDTFFAGSYYGIFRSIDSGALWERADIGLTDTDIFCLAVVGEDIFAGDVNYNGIFRSSDNGASWVQVNNGLPYQSFVYSFAVYGTNLFAGTDGGVYLTTDYGETWTSENQGVDANAFSGSLAIDSTYLFATYNGVSRRPLSEMITTASVGAVPLAVQPIAAYPNPCTSSATITFSCPESAVATVTIFNLLGSEVVRLFDGELSSGEHSFTWDASGTAPGMYECIVQSGGQIQRAPIVVVR